MTAMKANGWPEALVITSLLVGNCFYSVAKKSLSAASPLLESKLGATRLDLGDFSTSFSLSYGASKFIGGALSDMVSPFQLFTIGLYLAAALNIAISFASSISTIKLMWIVNGLSQGAGGPALSKLVVQMFPPHMRSDVWSNLTLACNMGYMFAPALLQPFAVTDWQGAFLASGVGCLLAAAGMHAAYVLLLGGRDQQLYQSQSAPAAPPVPVLHQQCIAPALAPAPAAPSTATTKGKDENKERPVVDQDTSPADDASPGQALTATAAADKKEPERIIENSDNQTRSGSSANRRIVINFVLLFVANGLAYFIAKAVQDWTGQYLVHYLQYPADAATAGSSGSAAATLQSLLGLGRAGDGPEMKIWELLLWMEIGAVLGVLLVSRLSQALGDRKSLASALFTLLCVAGLWSLALHLPGHDTSTAASHFMSVGSAYSSKPYGLDTVDVSSDTCSLASAGDAAAATCPQIASNEQGLHPIEQCRSNLLNTAVLLSPALPTFAQGANAAAISVGAALLSRIHSIIQVNRYFSMRCALFLVGFGINGPKTLVALELQDIVPSRYYGTCAGTAGAFAQLASAYAGRHVALMIDEQGWCSLMALLAANTAVLAALLFLSAII